MWLEFFLTVQLPHAMGWGGEQYLTGRTGNQELQQDFAWFLQKLAEFLLLPPAQLPTAGQEESLSPHSHRI